MKDNFGKLIFVGCSIAYTNILGKMKEDIVTFIDGEDFWEFIGSNVFS